MTSTVTTQAQQTLTLKQIKQMLTKEARASIQKPVHLIITASNKTLEDQEQMKRQIAQHIFDELTANEKDINHPTNKQITFIKAIDYEIVKTQPTIFQRQDVWVTANILIEQDKI